jgi:Protein of unknown function (DUF3500)
MMGGDLPPGRRQIPDQLHLAGAFQDNRIIPYEGVPASALSPLQRRHLLQLIAAYVEPMPAGLGTSTAPQTLKRRPRRSENLPRSGRRAIVGRIRRRSHPIPYFPHVSRVQPSALGNLASTAPNYGVTVQSCIDKPS